MSCVLDGLVPHGCRRIYITCTTIMMTFLFQIKALRDAGVNVTSSPAQMGSTLKKVMLRFLHVHC